MPALHICLAEQTINYISCFLPHKPKDKNIQWERKWGLWNAGNKMSLSKSNNWERKRRHAQPGGAICCSEHICMMSEAHKQALHCWQINTGATGIRALTCRGTATNPKSGSPAHRRTYDKPYVPPRVCCCTSQNKFPQLRVQFIKPTAWGFGNASVCVCVPRYAFRTQHSSR